MADLDTNMKNLLLEIRRDRGLKDPGYNIIVLEIQCNDEPVPLGETAQDMAKAVAESIIIPLSSYQPVIVEATGQAVKLSVINEGKGLNNITIIVVCRNEQVPGWGYDPNDMLICAKDAAIRTLGSYEPKFKAARLLAITDVDSFGNLNEEEIGLATRSVMAHVTGHGVI